MQSWLLGAGAEGGRQVLLVRVEPVERAPHLRAAQRIVAGSRELRHHDRLPTTGVRLTARGAQAIESIRPDGLEHPVRAVAAAEQ